MAAEQNNSVTFLLQADSKKQTNVLADETYLKQRRTVFGVIVIHKM
jgi:hypothetical protein